jgi:hypothetical protein
VGSNFFLILQLKVRKHEFYDEMWYLAPVVQILMDKRGFIRCILLVFDYKNQGESQEVLERSCVHM